MGRKAGRGNPIITEEKIEEFLGSQNPPMAGTTQIAEKFDVRRPSVIERLNSLEEKGVVGKREVGQSFAWYLDEFETQPAESVGEAGSHRGREQPEPTTDGGLPRWEARAMWLATFGAVSGLFTILATVGLGLESLSLWPRAFDTIHVTAYVLEGSALVLVASVLLFAGVFFAEWVRRLRRRLTTEWILVVRPRMRRAEAWIAANRPGGSA